MNLGVAGGIVRNRVVQIIELCTVVQLDQWQWSQTQPYWRFTGRQLVGQILLLVGQILLWNMVALLSDQGSGSVIELL